MVIFFLHITIFGCSGQNNGVRQELIEDLLSDYDQTITPIKSTQNSVNVSVHTYLYSLEDVVGNSDIFDTCCC